MNKFNTLRLLVVAGALCGATSTLFAAVSPRQRANTEAEATATASAHQVLREMGEDDAMHGDLGYLAPTGYAVTVGQYVSPPSESEPSSPALLLGDGARPAGGGASPLGFMDDSVPAATSPVVSAHVTFDHEDDSGADVEENVGHGDSDEHSPLSGVAMTMDGSPVAASTALPVPSVQQATLPQATLLSRLLGACRRCPRRAKQVMVDAPLDAARRYVGAPLYQQSPQMVKDICDRVAADRRLQAAGVVATVAVVSHFVLRYLSSACDMAAPEASAAECADQLSAMSERAADAVQQAVARAMASEYSGVAEFKAGSSAPTPGE